MTRKIFIGIILFTLTLAGKLIIDLSLYNSGGVNNHTLGAVIVFVALSACSWLSGWRSIPMYFFVFWALFDPLWGLFTGNGLLYIGTTAKLDILQRSYPVIQVAKYVLAVGGTMFFVIKRASVETEAR